MIILYLAIDALLAIIPAKIAKDKGKSFGAWYVYGLFLWLIAFIHSLCLQREEHIEEINVTENNNENGFQQYSLNLPVVITGYSLLKRENKLKLEVSLRNIGNVRVEALKVNAYGYNAFGEAIQVDGKDFFELLIQDVHLDENAATSIVVEKDIPDINIRKLELKITQVLTETMPVFAEILNFDVEKKLIEKQEEKEYFYKKNPYFRYLKRIFYPQQNDKYWLCSCGYINSNGSEECTYCHSNKEKLFSDIEPETIKEKCLEESSKQQKEKKIFKICMIIAGIIIALSLGIYARYYNIQKEKEEKMLASLSDMKEFTKYIGIWIDMDDEAFEELKNLLAFYNGEIEIFDYETNVEASYNTDTEIVNTVTFSFQDSYAREDYQDIVQKLTHLLGDPINSNKEVNKKSIYKWENVENASLYTEDYESVSNEEEINLELLVKQNKITMIWSMDEEDTLW